MRTEADSPFVGRDAELAQLVEAWRTARKDAATLALVTGEPGSGKTSLAGQLANIAHRGGAVVLYGRCDEEGWLPYQPFVEALRNPAALVPAAVFSARMKGLGRELARLLPTLSERLPVTDPFVRDQPELERYRLFEAVNGMLAGLAQLGPVVLIVDNLHWADHSTLLMFKHVVRATMSLFVVGIYQDIEGPRAADLSNAVADIRRDVDVVRVKLAGLAREEVRQLIDQRSVGSHDWQREALAAQIHRETAGNPFFVHEMLAEPQPVSRQGEHPTRSLLALVERPPESVESFVSHRLARLSGFTTRVLSTAAVAGSACPIDVLDRVLDASEDQVLDAVDEAVASRLIHDLPDAVEFRHAIVRRVLLSQLSTGRRSRLHAQFAHAVADTAYGRAHAATVAYHLIESGAMASLPTTLDWILTAARQAGDAFSFDEALELLQQAGALLDRAPEDDPRRKFDVLVELTKAQLRLLDGPAAGESLIAAAELVRGSSDRLASLVPLIKDAAMMALGSRRGYVIDVVERAQFELGEGDQRVESMLVACGAYLRSISGHGWTEMEETTGQALMLARASGDPEALAFALGVRWRTLRGSPTLPDQLGICEEQAALARARGDIPSLMSALAGQAMCRFTAGDADDFDRCVGEMIELARSIRDRHSEAMGQQLHAVRALSSGQFDRAEELIIGVFDAYPFPAAEVTAGTRLRRFWLAFERGRFAELSGLFEDLPPFMRKSAVVRSAMTMAAAYNDRAVQALAEVAALCDRELSAMTRDWLFPASAAMVVEAAARLGTGAAGAVEAANALYRALLPYAGQVGLAGNGSLCTGACDRHLGMAAALAGRPDEAIDHYRTATTIEERIGGVALVARTRYWHARALVDRGGDGDLEHASRLLAAARHDAKPLGMAGLVEDLDRVLSGMTGS